MSKTAEDNSQNSTTEKVTPLTLEESRKLLYQYCLAGNIKEVRNTIEKYKLDLDLDLDNNDFIDKDYDITNNNRESSSWNSNNI